MPYLRPITIVICVAGSYMRHFRYWVVSLAPYPITDGSLAPYPILCGSLAPYPIINGSLAPYPILYGSLAAYLMCPSRDRGDVGTVGTCSSLADRGKLCHKQRISSAPAEAENRNKTELHGIHKTAPSMKS